MAEQICQTHPQLQSDILWDGTATQPGHKLTESELVGYPLVIVIGSHWKKYGLFELRIRSTDQMIPGLSFPSLLDLIAKHLTSVQDQLKGKKTKQSWESQFPSTVLPFASNHAPSLF